MNSKGRAYLTSLDLTWSLPCSDFSPIKQAITASILLLAYALEIISGSPHPTPTSI